MKAKLVKEYIELPGKTKEQIISDMKYASKEQLIQALINVCREGQLDRVELLLSGGVDVNAQDKWGWTALMWASENGHKDIVELLLAKGADVNAKNNYGWTALMRASWYGSKDIVKLLLAKGADANAKTNGGWTALMNASAYGHKDVVKALLANGADVNAKDKDGWTALMWASWYGSKDIVELLLANGADVNAQDKDGSTALMRASANWHKDIVELLKKYGAKVNESVIGGAGYSVYGGSGVGGFGNPTASLGGKFLGGMGGSQNTHGGPNLMYTYDVKPLNQTLQQLGTPQNNDKKIHIGSKIKGSILNSNKDIEGQIIHIEEDEKNSIKYYVVLDKKGIRQKVDPTTTYLFEPEEFIDPKMADILQNENENNSYFYPLLEKISFDKQTKDVKGQIERSKKIPNELKEKIIPLIISDGIHGTRYNNGIVTRLKIPKINGKSFDGVDLEADKKHRMKARLVREYIELPGKTREQILSDMKYASKEQLNQTLLNACEEGHLDRVEMLLAGGVDINAKTNGGWTTLMLASAYGRKDIVELLLANGADVNAQDKLGRTALIAASDNGNKDIVELLLANGADANAKTNGGWTALMWASWHENKDIVELLKKYGAI